VPELNQTHDPELLSWVDSANQADSDFPIQNLPFAVFRRRDRDESFRGGVAIGDQAVDLGAVHAHGVFSGDVARVVQACTEPTLNAFMAMGQDAWSSLRQALSEGLRQESPLADKLRACLVPFTQAEFTLPARIGDYTDFYASIHHATNVGRLFRPDNPLMPNYKWIPVGYHGRASSIGISGQCFPRPSGQTKASDAAQPTFGPCQRLDYELEVGIFIGPGNEPGTPISLAQADSHVFGLCLLNDWSARDLQAWEYQPLGPFLSKNFASTISPWIITLEALTPFRAAWTRAPADPQPLSYLDSQANRATGAFNIQLETLIETEQMRGNGQPPSKLSLTSFRHSYWTISQMVAHHTVTGCNLQPGDLFGSGTQSGPTPDQMGSLLELTEGGKNPMTLSNGETRTFLQNGDTVIMRGWCEAAGAVRIGFGEVTGTVLPALY